MQSTKVILDQTRKISFYGLIKESHPEAVTQLEFKEELAKAASIVNNMETSFSPVEVLRRNKLFSQDLLTGTKFTTADIDYYFPKRQAEEKKTINCYPSLLKQMNTSFYKIKNAKWNVLMDIS